MHVGSVDTSDEEVGCGRSEVNTSNRKALVRGIMKLILVEG